MKNITSLFYKSHPFFLTLYPILHTLANNPADASFSQALLPLAAVFILSAVTALISYFVYKCVDKTAVITSIFIFLFFSYGNFRSAIHSYSGGAAGDNILLLSLLVIFLAAAFKIEDASKTAANNINIIITAFAAVLIIFPITTIAGDKYGQYLETKDAEGIFEEAIPDGIAADLPIKDGLPDIYHILLDEYGRSDVLKELYKIDNSEFINYLKQKGFFVAENSRCNYCYTDLSLLSTFNMNYLDEMAAKLDITESEDRSLAVKKLLWENAAFKTAKKAGYKTITFNTGELYSSITTADKHYSPFAGTYYNSFYINMLINLTPLPVILRAAGLNPFLFFDAADNHRRVVMMPFEKIDEIMTDAETNGPVFACLWIDSPHPPFVFDEKGNPIAAMKKGAAAIDRWAIESEEDRIDYINNYSRQLDFITQKTIALIDKIIKNSKRPPVIILQSDHGPASRFEFETIPSDSLTFKERFSILNAYYLGGATTAENGLHPSITPVNTFRIIFNRYLGTNLKILKDKNFHCTWLKPYKFSDVTDK